MQLMMLFDSCFCHLHFVTL